MDIEERFVNIAYDTIKIEVLENLYNILLEIVENNLSKKEIYLALTVKLEFLINSDTLEDDVKSVLYELKRQALKDIEGTLLIIENILANLKDETLDNADKIMEEINSSNDNFSLKIKKLYEKYEMLPFDFLKEFYKNIVRDMSLKKGQVIIEDIDSDLILLALKKHGTKKQKDGDKPPKI